MKTFALGCLSCVSLVIGSIAVAQTFPTHMYECESSGCGGDWKFTGRTGKAAWPQGVFADLTIERFDAEQVVIRRTTQARTHLARLRSTQEEFTGIESKGMRSTRSQFQN